MKSADWNEIFKIGLGAIFGFLLTITFLGDHQNIPFGTVAEWFAAIGTIGLIGAGVWQLNRQTFHQRQWATLQACDRYDTDSILSEAKRALRTARRSSRPPWKNHELEAICRQLFNYFDAVAIGIRQGLYVPEIVRDHLGDIMLAWYQELQSSERVHFKEFRQDFSRDYATLHGLLTEWGTKSGRSEPLNEVQLPVGD